MYVETFGALAQSSLAALTPRWKLRPKFHQYHCEVICAVAAGSRLSPRISSTFGEEDFVGKLLRVTKQAVHGSSLPKSLKTIGVCGPIVPAVHGT